MFNIWSCGSAQYFHQLFIRFPVETRRTTWKTRLPVNCWEAPLPLRGSSASRTERRALEPVLRTNWNTTRPFFLCVVMKSKLPIQRFSFVSQNLYQWQTPGLHGSNCLRCLVSKSRFLVGDGLLHHAKKVVAFLAVWPGLLQLTQLKQLVWPSWRIQDSSWMVPKVVRINITLDFLVVTFQCTVSLPEAGLPRNKMLLIAAAISNSNWEDAAVALISCCQMSKRILDVFTHTKRSQSFSVNTKWGRWHAPALSRLCEISYTRRMFCAYIMYGLTKHQKSVSPTVVYILEQSCWTKINQRLSYLFQYVALQSIKSYWPWMMCTKCIYIYIHSHIEYYVIRQNAKPKPEVVHSPDYKLLKHPHENRSNPYKTTLRTTKSGSEPKISCPELTRMGCFKSHKLKSQSTSACMTLISRLGDNEILGIHTQTPFLNHSPKRACLKTMNQWILKIYGIFLVHFLWAFIQDEAWFVIHSNTTMGYSCRPEVAHAVFKASRMETLLEVGLSCERNLSVSKNHVSWPKQHSWQLISAVLWRICGMLCSSDQNLHSLFYIIYTCILIQYNIYNIIQVKTRQYNTTQHNTMRTILYILVQFSGAFVSTHRDTRFSSKLEEFLQRLYILNVI